MKRETKLEAFYMASGFILIELIVVMALMGILIAVAIPTVSALGGVKLKREAGQIAGLLNEVYGRAALSGTSQRIVFDLDNNQFWVEEKKNEVLLQMPGVQEKEPGKVFQQEEDIFSTLAPQFAAVEGPLGQKTKLAEGVRFLGVRIDPMTEVLREGQAMLYFFSDGYTQDAFISVAQADDEKNVFSVSITSLTGQVGVQVGEPEKVEKQ